MSKNYFHQILTNTNFSVDYDTTMLVPQVELVILCANPAYTIKESGKEHVIKKGFDLVETRIHVSLNELNKIIGELQATAAALQQFDQMATGLNAVIAQAKKTKGK